MKRNGLYSTILTGAILLSGFMGGCGTGGMEAETTAAPDREISGAVLPRQDIRTEELDRTLYEQVDKEAGPEGKLKILFGTLNEDTLNHFTIYNGEKVLTDTMKRLSDFLKTEQGFGMEKTELESEFPGVSVQPLDEGRIITYSGKPETFGESADCRYVFYQTRTGDAITVNKLYEHDYLRFEKAFLKQLPDDTRLIFTTGITSMNFGSQHFLHAFRVDGDTCERVAALNSYKVGDQELVNTGGFVPTGFRIVKFAADEIDFEAVEENVVLKAFYQESDHQFSVKK